MDMVDYRWVVGLVDKSLSRIAGGSGLGGWCGVWWCDRCVWVLKGQLWRDLWGWGRQVILL